MQNATNTVPVIKLVYRCGLSLLLIEGINDAEKMIVPMVNTPSCQVILFLPFLKVALIYLQFQLL